MFPIELLTAEDAIRLTALANGAAEWDAGDATARGRAAVVKRNKQLRSGSAYSEIASDIAVRMSRSPVVQRYASPHHIMGIMVQRYDERDHYGPHVDSHQIGGKRADLSFTVLLHKPEAGGELAIGAAALPERRGEIGRVYELEPGEAVVYPSDEIHAVTPVEAGYRLVVVGWIESWIPEREHRRELERLARVRSQLEQLGAGLGSGPHIDRRACAEELNRHALELGRLYHNLHRRWGR